MPANAKELNLLKIFCYLFGHTFKVSKHVTNYVKEYKCQYCSKQMTTSSSGALTALTPKNKEINDTLNLIHNKRLIKKSRTSINL